MKAFAGCAVTCTGYFYLHLTWLTYQICSCCTSCCCFVYRGFEHCIANMFVIPLAMKLGAPISVGTFIVKNLIPSTIGNLIGGGIFVAMAFGLAFGSWEKAICAATSSAAERVAPGLAAKLHLGSASNARSAPAAGSAVEMSNGSGSSSGAVARIVEGGLPSNQVANKLGV
jgi:hypothetical protein